MSQRQKNGRRAAILEDGAARSPSRDSGDPSINAVLCCHAMPRLTIDRVNFDNHRRPYACRLAVLTRPVSNRSYLPETDPSS